MKYMKFISKVIVFVMIFSVAIGIQSDLYSAYAATYSGVTISSGNNGPINVVRGNDGKLYISEYNGSKIIKMDLDGQNKTNFISTLSQPIGMAFDKSGDYLYVAEHNGRRVVKIDDSGNYTLVKNITGSLLTGLVLDSDGKIFVADYSYGKIYKMDSDGNNFMEFTTGLQTYSIIGMAIDENDNLYVSDRTNSKIIKIDPKGNVIDFIDNVSSTNWITLGQDGYFYVSTGKRTLDKFDFNGKYVESFSTGTKTPWGSYITEDGFMYYADLANSICKIVGSASTIDTKHISLTMNTTMSAIHADAAAFTVLGVSSNPQVTAAVVTGQSIRLTLNSSISYFDSNIKVNYEKTGSYNIEVSGSAYELGDFIGLPVVNSIPRVTSVASIAEINVENGTSLNNIGLPMSISVNLSNSTTTSAAITWDGGTPEYNSSVAGTYAFSGTLILDDTVSNPDNLKASANVVVEKPIVTSVSSIPQISVSNGTALNVISLPTNVIVNLSNSTTTSAGITWDGGTPEYNSSVVGTYAFAGTLVLGDTVSNPSNLKANVDVVVQSAPSSSHSKKDVITKPVMDAQVIVNGKVQNSGTIIEAEVEGVKTATVDVNEDSLSEHIDEVLNNLVVGEESIIEVPVIGTGAGRIDVLLTGEIIDKMGKNNFDLKVTYDNVGYIVPAKEIDIREVSNKLGVNEDLSKLEIRIEISIPSDTVIEKIMQQADAKDYEIVIPPMSFDISITDTTTNKIVTVSKFTDYVERMFEIPADINPNKITTGIVYNDDGTLSHIPTKIVKISDKYYAKLNSLTNSTYSVIWNSITFKDMEGHWAKATANNMASRLVVSGVGNGNFDPDRYITRGEFAAIITKSLGIYRTNVGMDKYSDVGRDNIFFDAITIADNYGLIKGYTDGSYAPDKKITREEAMAVLIRATEIAKLQADSEKTLESFEDADKISEWAKAYVSASIEKNVIIGSNGKICPQDFISRAEVVTAIERLLMNAELINK